MANEYIGDLVNEDTPALGSVIEIEELTNPSAQPAGSTASQNCMKMRCSGWWGSSTITTRQHRSHHCLEPQLDHHTLSRTTGQVHSQAQHTHHLGSRASGTLLTTSLIFPP